jgi:hypothetical protein
MFELNPAAALTLNIRAIRARPRRRHCALFVSLQSKMPSSRDKYRSNPEIRELIRSLVRFFISSRSRLFRGLSNSGADKSSDVPVC